MSGRHETCQFERGRIVGLLECGLSQVEVAQRVGRSRCAVQGIWKKWKETHACANLPRSGRPRLTSNRDDRMLVRTVKNNRFVPYRLLGIYYKLNNIKIKQKLCI